MTWNWNDLEIIEGKVETLKEVIRVLSQTPDIETAKSWIEISLADEQSKLDKADQDRRRMEEDFGYL